MAWEDPSLSDPTASLYTAGIFVAAVLERDDSVVYDLVDHAEVGDPDLGELHDYLEGLNTRRWGVTPPEPVAPDIEMVRFIDLARIVDGAEVTTYDIYLRWTGDGWLVTAPVESASETGS